MLVLLVAVAMRAACVQSAHTGGRAGVRRTVVRRAVMRAVTAVLLVLLVLLMLLLVVLAVTIVSVEFRKCWMYEYVLITQHVRADRTCDQSTDSAQRSAAHLVAEESAASTSNECGAQTTLAICSTAWGARLTVLAGLLTVALLMLLIAVAVLLLLLTVLLVRVVVLLVLRWWWVGRVAAVGIVALIVLSLWGAIAVLLGSLAVRVMRWRRVLALCAS